MKKTIFLLAMLMIIAIAFFISGVASAASDEKCVPDKICIGKIQKKVQVGARGDYIGVRFSVKNYKPSPDKEVYLLLEWDFSALSTFNPKKSGEKIIPIQNLVNGENFFPEIHSGRGTVICEFRLTLVVKNKDGQIIETSNTRKFDHMYTKF